MFPVLEKIKYLPPALIVAQETIVKVVRSDRNIFMMLEIGIFIIIISSGAIS